MGKLYEKYGYGKDFSYNKKELASLYNQPNKWEYLGVEWEAYGDRQYFRNKETNEVWSLYISIGD